MSLLRNMILCLIVVASFVCCAGGSAEDSRKSFVSEVEMSDSAAMYDLWLTVRLKGDFKGDYVPLDIVVFSPDGQYRAEDRFVFPVEPRREFRMIHNSDLFRAFTSWYAYDAECLYRSDIRPDRYGEWRISMTTASESVSGIWARVEKQ